MLKFNDLPKSRKAEINKVVRAITEAFKTNKIDTKDIATKIRQNLLYMYDNELSLNTSVFSGEFKGSWNANSNEIVNAWDSFDNLNPKRIKNRNFIVTRDEEVWDFPIAQNVLNAPVSVTHAQYASMGVFVRETGNPIVQFETDNFIYPVSSPVPPLVSIDALNQGTSIQYIFVITKGINKVVKVGHLDKYVADSKSLDGVSLLPVMT